MGKLTVLLEDEEDEQQLEDDEEQHCRFARDNAFSWKIEAAVDKL